MRGEKEEKIYPQEIVLDLGVVLPKISSKAVYILDTIPSAQMLPTRPPAQLTLHNYSGPLQSSIK